MYLYPIIATTAIPECKAFYQKALDARVLFDSDWYLQLQVKDFELGFLRPNAPGPLPVFQHPIPSRGLCLALEVENVNAVFEDFRARGIEILGKPAAFANGETSFMVMDPAGVILSVVERAGRAVPTDLIAL